MFSSSYSSEFSRLYTRTELSNAKISDSPLRRDKNGRVPMQDEELGIDSTTKNCKKILVLKANITFSWAHFCHY